MWVSAKVKGKIASPADLVNDHGRARPQLRRLGLRDSARSKVSISRPVHVEIVVDEIILVHDSVIELPSTPVCIIS